MNKITDLMRIEDDDICAPTHSEILKYKKELAQRFLLYNSSERLRTRCACKLIKLMAKLTTAEGVL
jgi:hypothetical protein